MVTLFFVSAVALADENKSITPNAEDYLAQQQKITEIEQQLMALKAQSATMLAAQKLANTESTTEKVLKNQPLQANKNWQIKSYGSVRYKNEEIFGNTQDLDPTRRASTDLERVVLELSYDFTPQWQVELELEYEHGGTGVTLEYDGFEEFGEFESEIEAGGEVVVEKLQVRYQANKHLAVKMGRIFVPVGLGTDTPASSIYDC